MAEVRDPMLLVASDTELPPAERVWGTGGWLPPAAREALDWLTLARLCGWAVTVTRRNAPRLDGATGIAARPVGRGAVATLGFHPSEARDQDGAGTALVRHLLIWGAGAPVAWHELEGSLVLRMDDPGGAQNVHLRGWTYAKLT